jgi:hypothetical protein
MNIHLKISARGESERNKAFFNPKHHANTRETRSAKKKWNNLLMKKHGNTR